MDLEQHTLVAFYGKKTDGLSNLVHFIWEKLMHSSLKDFFIPYEMDQIHATIIGLEKIPGFSQAYNLNSWEKKGIQKQMKVSGLEGTLGPFFPMKVQFGGFQEDYSQIKSFGQSFYNRSCQINWQSGKVVLVGWPVNEDGLPTHTVFQMRQRLFQNHHILHKYEGDNDCYLVLGELGGIEGLSPKDGQELKSAQQGLVQKIREHLAFHPQQIQLKLNHLSVVEYTDTTLPLSSSQRWPLDKIDELFN